jgi:hypothetical protein
MALTRVVLGTAPMMVSIFWPFLNTCGAGKTRRGGGS